MSAPRTSPFSVRASVRNPTRRRGRAVVAGLAATALVAFGLAVADPAIAATSITVTTTADTDANGACTDTGVTTTASPISLRNALCVANNLGDSANITVPAGRYTLSSGEPLVIGTQFGSTTRLTAAGGRPVIQGDGSAQLITLDPYLVGGVYTFITGFELRGGRDTLYGGGAIIGGGGLDSSADYLNIDDTWFIDNSSTGGTANPGGAIQFIGGNLDIHDSTFDQNSSGTSLGGAIYYEAAHDGDSLTVDKGRFTNNTATGTSPLVPGATGTGGGAIAYRASAPGITGSAEIVQSTFTDNSVVNGTGSGIGGAIQQLSGPGEIKYSSFSGNTAAAGGAGAVDAHSGSLDLQFNSFTGNTGIAAVRTTSSVTPFTGANNWWGCNGGPSASGCDTVSLASGSAAPYLVLSAAADAGTVEPSETTELTASLRTNSAGTTLDGTLLAAFDGTSVSWSGAAPSGSAVAPSTSAFLHGEATATFTAGTTGGAGGATATYGSASVPLSVGVRQNPVFTSAATAAATVGVPFMFTVTTSGFPVPSLSLTPSALPPGLGFVSTGSSLTISGLPSAEGTYPLTLTAVNGGAEVQQTLTITVGSIPAFTGSLATSVESGASVDAVITTSGLPVPAITATAPLPAGLTLTDDEDGTARLHGTASAAPGEYAIPLAATNGIGQTTGVFTLTITADPSITSADHTTFSVGVAGDFPVTVDPGFPVKNTLTIVGAPAWLSLTGAAGAQHLVGTPPAGSGGVHSFTVQVSDAAVSQSFSLTVAEAPAITTQPSSQNAVDGTNAVFTAAASGYPAPTVQWQRFTGGSWSDIADATTTTLTIPATMTDDGARVRAVFTSTSGTATSDEAVLSVGQLPHVTPVSAITADAGWPLTVNISTTGLPHGAITATGNPGWLAFTDNEDGTASLTGLPSLANVGGYTVTVAVDNGFGTDDITVQITIVGAVPAFTSALAATIAEGDDLDVDVTAAGVPVPSITAAALPTGLALTDDEDGTAHLHGVPDLAPGVHTFDLTATNTHGVKTSTFTLTITAPPAFTSTDHASFTAGAAGTFPVTVDPGYPVLDEVTLSGAPAWLSLSGGALIGTPPAGSGGVYTFDLSITGSAVVQEFTLTVDEAPVITAQPEAVRLLDGADAVFTAAAGGYPAPDVQWQRFVDGSWTDIAGATSTTLSFPAAITDDGTRLRAVFTSTSGTATSDEVLLTVGQVPALAEIEPVTILAGGPLTIDVTSTGLPAGAITASGTPSWLTFTDNGDGTATIEGTPALTDAGDAEIALTIDNGFGTDQLTIEITVDDEVPLPFILGVADGPLAGVPATVLRGQQLTIGGSGFLPGAVVQLGIYSTPTALGTAVADSTGAFSATVTIPVDQSLGAHTVAASGIGATGTARLLIGNTTVVLPPATDSGSGAGGLPATGLDASQSLGLGLTALLAVLAGLVLVRAARRRAA